MRRSALSSPDSADESTIFLPWFAYHPAAPSRNLTSSIMHVADHKGPPTPPSLAVFLFDAHDPSWSMGATPLRTRSSGSNYLFPGRWWKRGALQSYETDCREG